MSESYKKDTKHLYEHDEQVKIFQWAERVRSKYPQLKFMYATLNGVKLGYKTAKKAKAAGNKKGVPDIHFPWNNGTHNGLYIELKVGYNQPTKEQKEYLQFLREQNFHAVVCYGFNHALKTLLKYLNKEQKQSEI